MTDPTMRTARGGWRTFILSASTSLATTACVIEKIDAAIAEHGVTYWPSSTGDDGVEVRDTSTSTGTGSDMGASTSTSTSAEETSQSQDIASGGSDAGTDASSGASSGPAGPVCGDGVVEGDETCDDANAAPDDGCQHCTKDSIVFITSAVYQGFDLGGLHGADQRCRSLAAKAGLAGADTFRAWLSTPTSAAADRLRHSRGRYVLVNGLVVARDWDALTSGALMNPITVDEHAQTQDSVAWTGTLLSGQPALGSKFCNDWDGDFELFVTGAEGLSASTDVQWSFFAQGLCDHENRLYCIEQ